MIDSLTHALVSSKARGEGGEGGESVEKDEEGECRKKTEERLVIKECVLEMLKFADRFPATISQPLCSNWRSSLQFCLERIVKSDICGSQLRERKLFVSCATEVMEERQRRLRG